MGTLVSGSLIARRFAVEELAGTGGMGEVYRASDRVTGQRVALKLLHLDADVVEADWFAREARMLSELRHPHIVAYVSSGLSEEGRPFLAMEWLEGEDLAKRLSRGPLPIQEALLVIRRMAEALEVMHRQGIVHRDLKPSNVFLRDGDTSRATILDFGIACRAGARTLTRTYTPIGTPEYMSPEQARCDDDAAPSSDVFSLGCILFECLTGRPPFTAEHLTAVLAKILFEAPPPLRDLCPSAPSALEALVLRMLEKEPAPRIQDASALLDALDELDASAGSPSARSARAGASIPPRSWELEQHLVCVLIASGSGIFADELRTPDETCAEALRRELLARGVRAEVLTDGSLVATLALGRGSATDQALEAARCALLIKARMPAARVALTTGRGMIYGRVPLGDAIDRASEALRAAEGDLAPGSVIIDEVTADLIGERFRKERTQSHICLLGETLEADATRPLLGKATPCVGREHELGLLESALVACKEGPSARAILVSGPPGMGKSRLRHELVRRIEARGEDTLILRGRADLMSASPAHGMLGEALRRLCGVQDDEEPTARWEKLHAEIGKHLGATDASRVCEFLGEMCGVPSPEADSPRLRAARQDPLIMRDQLERAFVDFLRAACAARDGVILLLEDLHWGDAPSVRLVGRALDELSDMPLFVLALARPEIDEIFPRLWGERAQRVPLMPLSKRACERLSRAVLGPSVPPEAMARMAEQSAGNALYLEELIRAHAEGKGDEIPASLLAMLQARLSRLPPQARRVLRAASVFGATFWRDGVRMLLDDGDIDRWLDALVEAEIVQRHRQSRFAADAEYGVRHALVREAAYDLVPEEDRCLGHRRAAAYLEAAGEEDPIILAEHWLRGGETAKARACYVRAAHEAFERDDHDGVIAHAQKAVALGSSGEELGTLRSMASSGYFWRRSWKEARTAGEEAMSLLPRGSRWWCRVMGVLCSLSGLGHQAGAFTALAEELFDATPEPEAQIAYVEAMGRLLCTFSTRLELEAAARSYARMREVVEQVGPFDPTAHGWARLATYEYCRAGATEPFTQLEMIEDAVRAFEEAGDQRMMVVSLSRMGQAYAALGAHEEAEHHLRAAVAQGAALEDRFASMSTRLHLCAYLASRPSAAARAEARALGEALIVEPSIGAGYAGWAHGLLGLVAHAEGDAARAEAELRHGIDLLRWAPLRRWSNAVLLGRVLLAQGRAEEAYTLARQTHAEAERTGGAGYVAMSLLAMVGETALAVGQREEAESATAAALSALRFALADVPEDPMRVRFVVEVEENTRVLALGRALRPNDVADLDELVPPPAPACDASAA
jgi:tetratricopeptide (TPR) repeat protein